MKTTPKNLILAGEYTQRATDVILKQAGLTPQVTAQQKEKPDIGGMA